MNKELVKTAAAYTIGCRLNQADTALIFDRLQHAGFEIVKDDYDGQIGVLIVNSCTVTSSAAQKSRAAVRKYRRKNPDCCIVLTGCSAEVDKDKWQKELSVDLVVPNAEKKNIVSHLENYFNKHGFSVEPLTVSAETDIHNAEHYVFSENAETGVHFKSRAFLKIQEGCNNFCSYCIVPYARGRERSRSFTELFQDFNNLLAQGYKEIVLTGVNVGSYNDNGLTLAGLLRKLSAVKGDFRIRLSSTEPLPENFNLLDVIAESDKICNFLHLSLQHGNNDILKAMNRNYLREEYAEFVALAREKIPNIHLGTDIIVGFPGETEAMFVDSCEFIEKIGFANIHIFTYSPREGTPAATFKNQVPKAVAKERYNFLKKIASKSAENYAALQVNKKLKVLFETENESGIFSGWSDNYLRVEASGKGLCENLLGDVEIVDRSAVKLIGNIIFPE